MTQTELANIALGLLGAETITDFTERTPAAERVRRHWPIVRDALLRSKNWNFATRRSSLSADADNAPEFDWTYAYALPGDYLKAIEFNARQAGTGEAHFEISGRFLLSNDDRAALKYTARVETVSEWDSSFCDAFAHALAAALAPGLSTAPGLGLAMRQQAEDIVAQAGGPNAVETRPRVVMARTGSGWLAARLGGVDPSISTAAAVSGSSSSSSSSGGGTITLSGDATGSGAGAITVTLAASGVTAGSYTNANITVDSKGRVTAASNGSGGSGSTNLGATAGATTVIVTSDSGTDATIPAATTSAAGVLTADDKTKLDAISGTNTGDQTITLSGDVSGSGTGSFTVTIGANKVTLAMMATVATATFLGRTTSGTGNVEAMTVAQATALLSAMVGDSGSGGTKGLVPAPAAGDAAAAKYLKADGTWAAVSGGGSPGGSDTHVQFNNAGAFGGVAGLVVNTTTGALTQSQTTDATTAVYGLTAATSSSASVGVQKWSPFIQQSAKGWGTTASTSQDVSFDYGVRPTQAAVPTGVWVIRSNIAGGGWTDRIAIGSDGVFTIGASGPSFAPNVGATGALSINTPNSSTTPFWIYGADRCQMTSVMTLAWTNHATQAFNGTRDVYLGRQAAANLRQGAADVASPVAQTFSVQSVSAGTSNTPGANRTFSASQGTGTGAGGNILFTVAPPSGSSGSTQNALVTALTIKGDAERCVEVEKLLSIVARAVSTLPSAATYAGCCANVNDALTPVAGTTVAGGGAARALVWSDGTNWKVVIA